MKEVSPVGRQFYMNFVKFDPNFFHKDGAVTWKLKKKTESKVNRNFSSLYTPGMTYSVCQCVSVFSKTSPWAPLSREKILPLTPMLGNWQLEGGLPLPRGGGWRVLGWTIFWMKQCLEVKSIWLRITIQMILVITVTGRHYKWALFHAYILQYRNYFTKRNKIGFTHLLLSLCESGRDTERVLYFHRYLYQLLDFG